MKQEVTDDISITSTMDVSMTRSSQEATKATRKAYVRLAQYHIAGFDRGKEERILINDAKES